VLLESSSFTTMLGPWACVRKVARIRYARELAREYEIALNAKGKYDIPRTPLVR
jgi:hypothetical protein